MQEEVPTEQAWQGGICFERTRKDFGHSVKGFDLYVFFVSVAVFGLFLFVIRMAQFSFEHLGVGWSRSTRKSLVLYITLARVYFLRVLYLRSSNPSATFSKTRAEHEDIRASMSSAGEALQEEIERHATGNH